ncbi:MAG: hypothetical protein IPL88_12410 [Rhizobiales bacterium]|nr:hypothetical protein [Hyphomicrobiales bacterium]
MTGGPLRLVVIVDSTRVARPIADCIEWARSAPGIELAAVVIERGGRAASTRARQAEARRLARSVWAGMGEIVALPVAATFEVAPVVEAGTGIPRYADAEIAAIRALGAIDSVVRLAPGPADPEIEHAASRGLFELRMDDARAAILARRPSVRCAWILHREGEELSFWDGAFPTLDTAAATDAATRGRALAHLKIVLERLTRKRGRVGEPPAFLPPPGDDRAYARDRLRARLGQAWRRRVRKRGPRWSVAFQFADWPGLDLSRGTKIPNPPNHFLADPFVTHEDGRAVCFVEDFDYARGLGHIAAYELTPAGARRLGDAIVEPFHMSFPFLFRHEGRLWMIPETWQAGEIRLYECVEFPLRWRFRRTLMAGVSAADTMVFPWGGRWAMATNIDLVGGPAGEHCTELSLFFADAPLDGPWTPHAWTPVIVDPERARNGGLLVGADGALHRVAQRQGFLTYGAGLAINRIDALDADAYAETPVRTIAPDFFPGLVGAHHMHSAGGVTVYDFCEMRRADD